MMIACPTHTLEWTRRRWLGWGGHSGLLSLVAMLGNTPCPGEHSEQRPSRATRVVFFFMNGGPSHIDTFDPKPALAHLDGTNYTGDVNINSGMRVAGTLWKSDFKFQRCGESGLEISELYPELSRRADDLCIIRSMHTPSSLHAPALLQLLFDETGAQRLVICLDPGDPDRLAQLRTLGAGLRVLNVACRYDTPYLQGHARRMGLVSRTTPPERQAMLERLIREQIEGETARLAELGLPRLAHLRDTAPAPVNAQALTEFLAIAPDAALSIARTPTLFAD